MIASVLPAHLHRHTGIEIKQQRSVDAKCLSHQGLPRLAWNASTSLIGAAAALSTAVLAASRWHRRRGIARQSRLTLTASSDDRLIRVAKGEDMTSVPVWLFRQAGRHLPEYREYKDKRGKNFLQLLEDPEDVAEVTMQPLRRYDLDAGILFSDILVVPQAMGLRVEMPGGKGITIPEPLHAPSDIGRLPGRDVVSDPSWVRAKLAHVMDAVRAILHRMDAENRTVPLIGFSAAPWTLLFYMVGGSSRRDTDAGETWLSQHPTESQQLLDMLTDIVIEYLSAQVEAGCHALQVFEAMGDFISKAHFEDFALPALTRIASDLRSRHPEIPLMVFSRGAGYASEALQRSGYDVVTVDCKSKLEDVETRLVNEMESHGLPPSGHVAVLQGNLDPRVLRPAEGGNVESARREARRLLAYRGLDGSDPARTGLIANLGEGLAGTEDPKIVAAFVDTIHELSAELGGR